MFSTFERNMQVLVLSLENSAIMRIKILYDRKPLNLLCNLYFYSGLNLALNDLYNSRLYIYNFMCCEIH